MTPPMTDDLVERLRKGRLIQKGEEITVIVDGVARKAGTGEIREMAHPDALEAAARIEALEAALGTAADFLALVLWADPGTKEAAARKAARDWWIKYDAANRAALTPEAPHAD